MKKKKQDQNGIIILAYSIFFGCVMIVICTFLFNILRYGQLESDYANLQTSYTKLDKQYKEASSEIEELNDRIGRLTR